MSAHFQRRLAGTAAAVILFASASAAVRGQDVGEAADPAAAFAEAREVCADETRPELCRVLQEQIADYAAQSLLVVGASGQRAAAVETVRTFADWPQPMVRYAAATALGGLHPAAEDTPVLARLLNDPVPAVRSAARASLAVSSDPAARRLVERARERQGIAMEPEGPLVDPSALPVPLPDGAEPVRFTDDAAAGVAAWVTDTSREAVLTALAAGAGAEPIDLDALAALFASVSDEPPLDMDDAMAVMRYMTELQQRIDQLPEDQQEAAYTAAMMELAAAQGEIETDANAVDRWRDADRYGAPMAVVLPADPALPMPFPTRIALVYDDVALGRTGFALQWVAPAMMPPAPEPEAQASSSPPSTLFGLQSTPADATPDPAAVEEQIWEAVLMSEDPEAARLFAEAFPDSAHAAEAIRLRDTWPPLTAAGTAAQSSLFGQPPAATPSLSVEGDGLVGNQPIVVRYSGLAAVTERSPWIAVSPAGSNDASWDDWAWAPDAEGSVSLPHQRAGEYELRVYLEGPREVIARLQVTVAPVESGAYRVPTLEPDKAGFAVGEPIGVRWYAMPGDRSDWITVVPVGTPDTTWGDWAYTDGNPSGRLELSGQDEPGAYEIRAYLESPREVVARIPITVAP